MLLNLPTDQDKLRLMEKCQILQIPQPPWSQNQRYQQNYPPFVSSQHFHNNQINQKFKSANEKQFNNGTICFQLSQQYSFILLALYQELLQQTQTIGSSPWDCVGCELIVEFYLSYEEHSFTNFDNLAKTPEWSLY